MPKLHEIYRLYDVTYLCWYARADLDFLAYFEVVDISTPWQLKTPLVPEGEKLFPGDHDLAQVGQRYLDLAPAFS